MSKKSKTLMDYIKLSREHSSTYYLDKEGNEFAWFTYYRPRIILNHCSHIVELSNHALSPSICKVLLITNIHTWQNEMSLQ